MNFNKKIILNSLDDTADIAKEIASELETYPKNKASIISVSYTHLTLPTSDLV